MANQYNTGNPVPSTSPKDLSDNASNFDEVLNSDSPQWTDRRGRRRETLAGLQAEFDEDQAQRQAQFNQLLNALTDEDMGVYAAGITLTRRNQVFQRSGVYYRAAATTVLPYTTTGDWATESSKFVLAGDSLLRGDLSNSTDPSKGVTLIGASERVVADLAALRAYPKTGSQRVMTGDLGGHWILDPADSTSVEDLNRGILVANDGGRWKAIPGSTRAQTGMPGTTYNDNGYAVGWWHPGADINGNGNKFNYFSFYIADDRVVQQVGLNGATGSKVDGVNITMITGGEHARGGRHALDVVLLQGFGGGGAFDPNNLDHFKVAGQFQVITETGDGGTGPLDTRGALFATSMYTEIRGAAKYVSTATGCESNVFIIAGTGDTAGKRVDFGSNFQAADFLGERAYGLDVFFSMSCLGGSPRGRQYGIASHGRNGAPAFEADSTFIKLFPTCSGSQAIDAIIDSAGLTVNSIIRSDGVNLRSGVLDMNAPGSLVSLGSGGSASTVQLQGKSSGQGSAYDGRIVFTGGTSTTGRGNVQVDGAVFVTAADTMRGAVDNYTHIGTSAYRYSGISLATSPEVTSDLDEKENIKPLGLGLEFVNAMAAHEKGLIEFTAKQGGSGDFVKEELGTEEYEETLMEEYEEEVTTSNIVEGKVIETTHIELKQRPVFDVLPVVDAEGNPVVIERKEPETEIYVNDKGEEVERVKYETYFDDMTGEEKKRVIFRVVKEEKFARIPRKVKKTRKIFGEKFVPQAGQRVHLGVGAQTVNEILTQFGYDNCAAWGLTDKNDPNSRQFVREGQLISVLMKAVSELSDKVDALSMKNVNT